MPVPNRGWTAERLNLLSPEIVEKVGRALDAGLVCGLHAFYAGGCGPEPCAFADLDSYLRRVEGSRPGDRLTLWSVAALGEQGRLLIHKRGNRVQPDELLKSKEWLGAVPGREFLAAGAERGGPAEAQWGDLDWFERIEDLAKYAVTGEFAVLPLTDLQDEDDPSGWISAAVLAVAKRPNERGEVPIGGAY